MSAPDATPVFAIAGMHRSGTSLVAGLVRAAGLPMGEELVGASATNPHGHHEDRAFVALHDAALAACAGVGTTRVCVQHSTPCGAMGEGLAGGAGRGNILAAR